MCFIRIVVWHKEMGVRESLAGLHFAVKQIRKPRYYMAMHL